MTITRHALPDNVGQYQFCGSGRGELSGAAEALRYLQERHAQGKVVLTVEHSNGTE